MTSDSEARSSSKHAVNVPLPSAGFSLTTKPRRLELEMLPVSPRGDRQGYDYGEVPAPPVGIASPTVYEASKCPAG